MNTIKCHYALRINGLTERGEKSATRRIDALKQVFNHVLECAEKNQLQQLAIDFDCEIPIKLFNTLADGEKQDNDDNS